MVTDDRTPWEQALDDATIRSSVTKLMDVERAALHLAILRELDRLAETASHLRADDEGPDSILYAGYLDDLILDCRVLTYAVENAIRYPRQP